MPTPTATDSRIASAPSGEHARTGRALLVVFLALVVGNLLVIAFLYRQSVDHERDSAYQRLNATAEFKERSIHRWRLEKLDELADFEDAGANNQALAAILRGNATPDQIRATQARLQRQLATHGNHSIVLVRANGTPVLATDGKLELDPRTRQQLRAIALAGGPEMLGLHESSSQPLIDLVAPIFERESQLLGFVVVRVNLIEPLQTLINQWNDGAATGEALLVLGHPTAPRRLTRYRLVDEAPEAFQPAPITDHALKRAALSYVAEHFESTDHRGQSVLIATRPVEETNWILVTKVDLAEVLAEARRQITYLFIGSLLLIAVGGLTVARLWRIQLLRDRQRMEEEYERQRVLRSMEARLNEAQRFGKLGSWERDMATGTMWWSEGMFALVEATPHQGTLSVEDAYRYVHPDDINRLIAATESRQNPEERGGIEVRLVTKTQEIRHVHHQWQTVFDAQGKAIKRIGTTQDITDRVRAETALRDQLDMLNTLIENVPGGVTLFDSDLRLRFHNRQYQVLLDFPDDLFQDEAPSFETFVRYNAWRGEYGPGDPEIITAEAMKRASNPSPHLFERDRPDGTSIEIRGAPLKGGGFVTIYTDITARKQAEQRQELSEKIIATSPTAILITNPRNRIVFVNPAFTSITGYTLQDVEGKDPKTFASGRHDKAFYQTFWEKLKAEDHWSGEIWDRRKDGSVYPKWLSVHTLRNSVGRLTNYVAMFTDITERKQAEQRIHHLAHHDPLTGLANRVALEARLEQAIADARRNERKVALLFIDLDRFKMVNDSLGHAVGDLMLMEIAGRLTERLRSSDIVARLGGDEFVVVLPELPDASHAALVAQSLLEDLAKPIKAPSTELHTSGSIGIAIYPSDGESVDSLMQSADTAMYEAKSAGRNAFRFFTRAMTETANDRLQLENDLRSAVIREQFELHYQPQVAPADGKIVGVEALLRWRHPTNGMVGPDRFIPLAEETGLIVEIGNWVLREGCRQARAWLDANLPVRMAINLSARQLRSDNLLPLIRQTVAEFDLPAQSLELEITESALMEHPDDAITILNSIKALGVQLALDDFGTGYSSLAYLKRFPIDRLKIDRSFVRDIETDPNDRAIALSTIALAHSLGLEVTAEGVEEAAQRDFLRDHGCNDAQGWFYSKALPAPAVEVLLRKGVLP